MNRDDNVSAKLSDWYTICNLGALVGPLTSVPYVGLFIDDSGSMHVSTVQASLTEFERKVGIAGLTIRRVVNGNEDWITPFMTVLAHETFLSYDGNDIRIDVHW